MYSIRRTPRALLRAAAPLLASLLLGCRSAAPIFVDGEFQPVPPGGVDFGKFTETAKPRMGGLPYPGSFTLFELADPNRLGHHAYNVQLGTPEAWRGILYTCHGGFIDIAHVRKSIDLTKHVAVRAEFALNNDWTAFKVKALEPGMFIIRLNYPPFWSSLTPEEKAAAHELSIRIGQRLAMVMVTWHELLTWAGYQSTPIASEKQSAFTWDDTGAHAFGVMVAGRALRDSREWDDAVTDHINSALGELGVVSPEECMFAIERIHGLWWDGFDPLKRQIELGWNGEPVEAWLVRDLPFCKNPVPHRYFLPQLKDVNGRDYTGLLHVEIAPDPFNFDAERLRKPLPAHPRIIDVDKDIPVILDYVRQSFAKNEGPQSLKPY